MKKNITCLLLFLFLILIPLKIQAVDIALSCYDTGSCNLCDALSLGQKIMRAILGLAGSLALLFFVWAGFKMIISQGNASKFGEAQKMMTTAVVGIFIVLLAWTLVNFVIWALVSGQGTPGAAQIFTKPWQKIECTTPPPAVNTGGGTGGTGSYPNVPVTTFAGCVSSWEGSNACTAMPFPSFSWGSQRAEQKQDASNDLIRFLTNLNNGLFINHDTNPSYLSPGEVTITSVSDDNGIGYCRDSDPFPRRCENDADGPRTNCCWHSENSCHYGNDQTNGSYAVDIRLFTDDEKEKQLKEKVEYYGGYFKREGDHYHVSYRCSGY